ncbi:hypothetical protein BUY79_12605 [Staphylococcus equorum]|uniref:hypothetical protein n=1 Tax=Staphylococcus equorum TaxID=246432 RepID=UPI000D1C2E0D|nr:hypothetical protein [Staphylococcus equorum]PTE82522.1 hypothetical protein BUY79_12605 [Staphylococcus equorum]
MKQIEKYLNNEHLEFETIYPKYSWKVKKAIKIKFSNMELAIIQLKNNHYRAYEVGNTDAEYNATRNNTFVQGCFKQVEIIEMLKNRKIII